MIARRLELSWRHLATTRAEAHQDHHMIKNRRERQKIPKPLNSSKDIETLPAVRGSVNRGRVGRTVAGTNMTAIINK